MWQFLWLRALTCSCCLNVWQCRHAHKQIRLLKIHFTNHPFQLPRWEQSFCPAAPDNWNPISDKWNLVICCLTGKLLTYALYSSVHWLTIVSNLRLKMRIGLLPSSFVNTTKWQKNPTVGAPSLLSGKILAHYLHRASLTSERPNMADRIWPPKHKNRDSHLFLSNKSEIHVTLKKPRLQDSDTGYREKKVIYKISYFYKYRSNSEVNRGHWLLLMLDISHDLLVYIFRLSIVIFSSTGLISSSLL